VSAVRHRSRKFAVKMPHCQRTPLIARRCMCCEPSQRVSGDNTFTLRQIDQARGDPYGVADDIEFLLIPAFSDN
jgi:hypothetical protein